MRPNRFLTTISGIAVVAAAGAVVAPLAVPSPTGFLGAVVTTGLVALTFAGYNAYSVLTRREPRFAAAGVAAIAGLWLVAAPVTYGVGAAATATTQLAGTILASTAGYATLDAVERGFRDVPAVAESTDERRVGAMPSDDD